MAEVLAVKKRKQGLAFQAKELEPDDISDDEYQIEDLPQEDLEDEQRLNAKLNMLLADYLLKTSGKESTELSLPKKRKRLDWLEHLSVEAGSIELQKEDIENDFKRELAIYNVTIENTKKAIRMMEAQGVPVEKPEDYKAEMFKPDTLMEKIDKNQKQIEKRKEVVEIRKQVKHKRSFAKATHEKEKQRKVQRNLAKKSDRKSKSGKNKKRPGKWTRDRLRTGQGSQPSSS